MQSITIRRPDDFHVHLRQGAMLKKVIPGTARHFARALVMPNTDPPILNGGHVLAYRQEIMAAVPEGVQFEPLMTIKLTHATDATTVRKAKEAGAVAAKLYPEGVTTNSTDGVRDIRALFPVFQALAECGMVLCIHGEVTEGFCMDLERLFLPMLDEIRLECPQLKMVLEHITDAQSFHWVACRENIAATITPHHLLLTLNDVVGRKLKPHHFCMPIAKTFEDRATLIRAAIAGGPKFFLGTDSAPHAKDRKECSEGCAGIYNAPVALAVLAEVFDKADRLECLEDFVSTNGARFYGLPLNEGTITLERRDFNVPWTYPGDVVPLRAGMTLPWRVAD